MTICNVFLIFLLVYVMFLPKNLLCTWPKWLEYVLILWGYCYLTFWNFIIISIFTPISLTEKDLSLETLDSSQFSLVYCATLRFLICIYLLFFWIWDNAYVTDLNKYGSQHFCISKFLCSFIVSLCCHRYHSVFLGFLDFCHSHFFQYLVYILDPFVYCFWATFD